MNEFTSERKIMSVVVQERSTGKYFSFVKGAESQIMNRLSIASANSPMKDKIEKEVFRFGLEFMVLVLLSASVKRVGVSPMHDF